jgi:integrase
MWVALDDEFASARSTKSGQAEVKASTRDPAERAAGALQSLRRQRDEAAKAGKLDEFIEHQRVQLDHLQYVLSGQEEPTQPLALHEAHRNAIQALLTGEGAIALALPEPRKQAADTPKLSEVHALWVGDQERPASTRAGMKRALDYFMKFAGDMRVGEVSRKDITAFADKLREPGGVTDAGSSIANTNTILSLLSALFGFAVRRNLIDSNPASSSRLRDPRRARERRREFDAPALKAIFESPVYSKGERPEGGAGEAAYWVPLLALYTGARINELCQLHPDNVAQEAYVDAAGNEHTAWVIRIEDDKAKGQALKTEGSERRIPVHPDLIGLGFISYAQGQAGKPLLFPMMKTGAKDGKISGNWGRWWGRYLRKTCGVTDERMTFHSFRHTFKHLARQSLIPADVHNALTGHETRASADAYGGLSYPLAPLVEGMKAYRVPGFKLPAPPAGVGVKD